MCKILEATEFVSPYKEANYWSNIFGNEVFIH